MYHFFRNFILITLFFALNSCSVILATRNAGSTPQQIAKCKNRHCLTKSKLKLLEQRRNQEGKIYYEKFYALFPTGSHTRAGMNAVFDVATLGMWEVVGTPREAIKHKKKGYEITVNYAADGKTITHMKYEF